MLAQKTGRREINVPEALKLVSITAGVLGVLTILTATLVYVPEHPDFSLLSTFLSDIGDTPGWAQVLFNSGMILVAPLRYLVLVLFAMRLWELGAGRRFGLAVLSVGFIATSGTVAMTAVPFSVSLSVHKAGIGMYFFGVVILQSIIFSQEWSMKDLPRSLPVISISLVGVYLLFFGAFMAYELGIIGRSLAVVTEWACALTSLAWVFIHGLVLGRK